MLYFLFAILAGFLLLVWSADRFVYGAASIAEDLGMSKLMVGLTIVAIGTSAPEILVSGIAALDGVPGLAIGNVIGSNLANVGLVLGLTALIVPLPVHRLSMREDLPAYLLILACVTLLLVDNNLNQVDGIILLAMLIVFLTVLVKFRTRVTDPEIVQEYESLEDPTDLKHAILWFLIGLTVLIGSSKLLVWGSSGMARAFGVSDLVIGLTIVAVGTSLPELASSITSAVKQHHDLAIGNIIGSNIFNLLAVLPMPALFAPGLLEPHVLSRDYMAMVLLTLTLALFVYLIPSRAKVGRLKGAVLFSGYAGYLAWLAYSSSGPV